MSEPLEKVGELTLKDIEELEGLEQEATVDPVWFNFVADYDQRKDVRKNGDSLASKLMEHAPALLAAAKCWLIAVNAPVESAAAMVDGEVRKRVVSLERELKEAVTKCNRLKELVREGTQRDPCGTRLGDEWLQRAWKALGDEHV